MSLLKIIGIFKIYLNVQEIFLCVAIEDFGDDEGQEVEYHAASFSLRKSIYTNSHLHTLTHMHAHTLKHSNTLTHTHALTHPHTLTHTYTNTNAQSTQTYHDASLCELA